jgi:hypothetical protein
LSKPRRSSRQSVTSEMLNASAASSEVKASRSTSVHSFSACFWNVGVSMTVRTCELYGISVYIDSPNASGRFVLALPDGSADFDGSTVQHDSPTRAWQKFHNDARTNGDAFAALVTGMETCKIDLR